jgi:MATE family multidrug resistance protein
MFKGMFSLALPWWAADCFTLIATQLGTDYLAAQTILRSVTLLTFMTPVGLSIVTQIQVGCKIGANKVADARYYAVLGAMSATCLIAIMLTVLNISRDSFVGFFTQDPVVM